MYLCGCDAMWVDSFRVIHSRSFFSFFFLIQPVLSQSVVAPVVDGRGASGAGDE